MIKEQLCGKSIELLTISMRPCYVWREFLQCIFPPIEMKMLMQPVMSTQ